MNPRLSIEPRQGAGLAILQLGVLLGSGLTCWACSRDPRPRVIISDADAGLVDASLGQGDAGSDAAGPDVVDAAVALHPRLQFVEVAAERGVNLRQAYRQETLQAFFDESAGFLDDLAKMIGGIAASDIDRDGWVDVFVVGGDAGGDRLFKNQAGSFDDVTSAYELQTEGFASGPSFADLDGDGFVDLLLPGIWGSHLRVLRNLGGERFAEWTQQSNLRSEIEVVGSGIGDVDADGDLDVLFARWGRSFSAETDRQQLFWRNDGQGMFEDESALFKYPGLPTDDGVYEYALVANFADIDDDGYPEALIASDFGTTSAFRNVETAGGRGFESMPREVFTDENAMSSSIGDVDNDGDLDWFMTSISAETAFGYVLKTGNRLYENRSGSFVDSTESSGLRRGSWGWASCLADFDNDGFLDVFHVNGYGYESPETQRTAPEFLSDRSRLFLNDGNAQFHDVAAQVGIDDELEGRAAICFDYDRDGDVDVLVSNIAAPVLLYENRLDPPRTATSDDADRNFLGVRLEFLTGNRDGIGARVYIESGAVTQMREIRIENGYVSQGPPEAHFGLGGALRVDEVRVVWPRQGSGPRAETRLRDVAANQELVVRYSP